jgi:hypothetical protein
MQGPSRALCPFSVNVPHGKVGRVRVVYQFGDVAVNDQVTLVLHYECLCEFLPFNLLFTITTKPL